MKIQVKNREETNKKLQVCDSKPKATSCFYKIKQEVMQTEGRDGLSASERPNRKILTQTHLTGFWIVLNEVYRSLLQYCIYIKKNNLVKIRLPCFCF